jgi:hypothetical protein
VFKKDADDETSSTNTSIDGGDSLHSPTSSRCHEDQVITPGCDLVSPEVTHLSVRKAFCIDSDISSKREDAEDIQARIQKMQRWTPAPEDMELLSQDIDLNLGRAKTCSGWDQFKANRDLFGVVSTFKDDLSQYTTSLNISKVPLQTRRIAERVAAEIERSMLSSKEQDSNLDHGHDYDEEAMFSSVPRYQNRGTLPPPPPPPQHPLRSLSAEAQVQRTSALPPPPPTPLLKEVSAPRVIGTFIHVEGSGPVNEQVLETLQRRTPLLERTDNGQHVRNAQTLYFSKPILPQGTEVVLEGLLHQPAFNGLRGIVQSFDYQLDRYSVLLILNGVGGRQEAKIRAQNLRLLYPLAR